MLKIHKPFSKHKLLLISITSICIVSGFLGIFVLTYMSELSHAEQVTEPESRPDLSSITYMQDITQEICANTNEADKSGNYQYQLIDKRDNKTYWVAKLKDNNCWMTQNLDYDTSPTSSGLSSWSQYWGYRGTYDPGKIVPLDPANPTHCKPDGQYPADVSQCTTKTSGWKDVSNLEASSESDFYDKNGKTVADDMYDAHYLVGNYYSFWSATNQNYVSMSKGEDASTSICPAGWQLPSSGVDDNLLRHKNGGFTYLFDSYGWSWDSDNGLYSKSLDGGTGYDIRFAPFYYMVYGEVMNGHSGQYPSYSVDSIGFEGTYWSSTFLYDLEFTVPYDGSGFISVVSPANTGAWTSSADSIGRSVRCLFLGGEKVSNVEVAVNPTISLDMADEVVVEKSETNPLIANLDVKVSSNQKYSVGISTTNPELISATSDVTIPAKSGLLNTAENGWGIKLKDDTEFTALTSTLQTFYTASGAEIKTIPFTIGISTAPDLPNGEYSTDITVTATQN